MIQETEYVILNPSRSKTKIIQCLCLTHTHSVADVLLKAWEMWSTGWNVGLWWMNPGSLLLCDPRSHFISLHSDSPTNVVLPACIICSLADAPSNRSLPRRPNRKANQVVNMLIRLRFNSLLYKGICVSPGKTLGPRYYKQNFQWDLGQGILHRISVSTSACHNICKVLDAKFPIYAAVLHSSSSGIPEDFGP